MSNQGRRKQEQTVPLIFERVRSRVTREVSMPVKTGEDLDRYIEWACEEVGAEPTEAMTLVMEHALGQFFQRDKLFQDCRNKESARTPTPASPAPGSPPSSGARSTAATSEAASGTTSAAAGSAKGASPNQPSNTRPAVAQ